MLDTQPVASQVAFVVSTSIALHFFLPPHHGGTLGTTCIVGWPLFLRAFLLTNAHDEHRIRRLSPSYSPWLQNASPAAHLSTISGTATSILGTLLPSLSLSMDGISASCYRALWFCSSQNDTPRSFFIVLLMLLCSIFHLFFPI
jgi:hypothetical protein